jgi:hypothetical protein
MPHQNQRRVCDETDTNQVFSLGRRKRTNYNCVGKAASSLTHLLGSRVQEFNCISGKELVRRDTIILAFSSSGVDE